MSILEAKYKRVLAATPDGKVQVPGSVGGWLTPEQARALARGLFDAANDADQQLRQLQHHQQRLRGNTRRILPPSGEFQT